jgi:hypothetical protein
LHQQSADQNAGQDVNENTLNLGGYVPGESFWLVLCQVVCLVFDQFFSMIPRKLKEVAEVMQTV